MTSKTDNPRPAQAEVTPVLAEAVPEAVLHLRSAIHSGLPWRQALLQAMGLWTLAQETYRGHSYHYLIQGEAFDWLTLAERLCFELEGAATEAERERLLFLGQLDEEVTPQLFRDLLGPSKYAAFLNYWYGVVVEEALQLAVEQDVRKRHLALCFSDSDDLVEQAFTHLYRASRTDLLLEFRQQASLRPSDDLSLTNVKEFTYWLFKRRLRLWDPARVASDTQRGIEQLKLLGQSMGPAADAAGLESAAPTAGAPQAPFS
ncbi:MAG: hypothetical protein EXR54_10290 [Dehalococcoidia bacterium]|nr:hypothetical protein [Dehalococcoidia bacterium]MSQ17917.1 hypothetical protein [Dehalococcoidia bacterium]